MIQPELHFYDFGEGVRAFSSTRHGGFSKGHYAAFNINHYCGDSEEDINQNRALLCQLLGIEETNLVMPHQVHQTKVATIDEAFLELSAEDQKAHLEGVDALMTDRTGVCIGVSTADCIPILLYDKVHHASCAIHAGWRGTVKRIVEKAVAKMTTVYGTRPADLLAQIGPGIHLESFEVGDEVYEAFANEGFVAECVKMGPKWHIDLPTCNRQQLLAAGVPMGQISVSPVDTYQQYDTYFSARRLGINSGRIFTGILLR